MTININDIRPGDTATVTGTATGGTKFEVTGEVWEPSHSRGNLWVGPVSLSASGITVTAHQPAPEPEWEKGTFGTATVRGEARRGFIEEGTYRRGFRFYNRGGTDMTCPPPADFRPLVVLDPESDTDRLSNIIREVDGNHDLGAGALAEAILQRLAR